MDVEKIEIDILSLNKITLINHPLGNLTDPDGCDLSNHINLLKVTELGAGHPAPLGTELAAGRWPQPQPLGLGKPACNSLPMGAKAGVAREFKGNHLQNPS